MARTKRKTTDNTENFDISEEEESTLDRAYRKLALIEALANGIITREQYNAQINQEN